MFATSQSGDNPSRAPCQPRRGLRRRDAALYVGVSPTTFDAWVADGLIPHGKRRGGVLLWDVKALDRVLDDFFGDSQDEDNPWHAPAEVPAEGEGRAALCPKERPINPAAVRAFLSGRTEGVSGVSEVACWDDHYSAWVFCPEGKLQ